MRPRVLVVDWDEGEAHALAAAFAAAGLAAFVRLNSIDGLVAVEDERPVLVVLRWDMPYIDGDTFVRAMAVGLVTPPPVLVLAAPAVADAPPHLPLRAAWQPVPASPAAVVRRAQELLGLPTHSSGV